MNVRALGKVAARTFVRKIVILVVVLMVVASILVGIVNSLPATAVLADRAPTTTSYMRMHENSGHAVLAERRVRHWSSLTAISAVLVCAVVKAEDRGFFEHRGFEGGAMLRAVMRYIAARPGGGGSTITQQLARNLYLSPAPTVSRKLREFLIAERLEATLSKQRILELYLNLAEWGSGIWGADTAARYYFGVGSEDINTFEASFLAAMLAAPSRAPMGQNGKRVYRVQLRVLHQMAISGLISESESESGVLAADIWYRAVKGGLPWHIALDRAAAWYRQTQVAGPLSGFASEDSVWGSCGYLRELAYESSSN